MHTLYQKNTDRKHGVITIINEKLFFLKNHTKVLIGHKTINFLKN